jgi:hypothetical protein
MLLATVSIFWPYDLGKFTLLTASGSGSVGGLTCHRPQGLRPISLRNSKDGRTLSANHLATLLSAYLSLHHATSEWSEPLDDLITIVEVFGARDHPNALGVPDVISATPTTVAPP